MPSRLMFLTLGHPYMFLTRFWKLICFFDIASIGLYFHCNQDHFPPPLCLVGGEYQNILVVASTIFRSLVINYILFEVYKISHVPLYSPLFDFIPFYCRNQNMWNQRVCEYSFLFCYFPFLCPLLPGYYFCCMTLLIVPLLGLKVYVVSFLFYIPSCMKIKCNIFIVVFL